MDETSDAFALVLDGKGGARSVSLEQVSDWKSEDGPLWVHLPPDLPDLARVLEETCHMPVPVREQLLADTGRVLVEVTPEDEVVLLLLEPDLSRAGMLRRQLRVWASPRRCVTVAGGEQPTLSDLRLKLEQGRGPRSADLLHAFVASALTRATLDLAGLNDRLAELEERVEDRKAPGGDVRDRLRRLRRRLVEQRRFASLAQDAIVRFDLLDVDWVHDQEQDLRRLSERAASLLKELDSMADRARIVHEELKSRQDEKTQRTLYLLTVISGVFLPVSFVTGLLGVNVGGIPGTQWRGSFVVLCILLVGLAVAEWWALRRRELV